MVQQKELTEEAQPGINHVSSTLAARHGIMIIPKEFEVPKVSKALLRLRPTPYESIRYYVEPYNDECTPISFFGLSNKIFKQSEKEFLERKSSHVFEVETVLLNLKNK